MHLERLLCLTGMAQHGQPLFFLFYMSLLGFKHYDIWGLAQFVSYSFSLLFYTHSILSILVLKHQPSKHLNFVCLFLRLLFQELFSFWLIWIWFRFPKVHSFLILLNSLFLYDLEFYHIFGHFLPSFYIEQELS